MITRNIVLLVIGLLALFGSTQAQTLTPILAFQVDNDSLPQLTVSSNTSSYHVLEARNASDTEFHPIAIAFGANGTQTLHDNLLALPQQQYRVLTYAIASPGDQDQDGIDDITELNDLQQLNPLNPARAIPAQFGTIRTSDSLTIAELSIASDGPFDYLAGSVFTKLYLTANTSDTFGVYFMDIEENIRHSDFARDVGIPIQSNGFNRQEDMRGLLVFHPDVIARNGVQGVYTFQFPSTDEHDFALIQRTHDLIAASMPFLRGNLAYRPLQERARDAFARERAAYDASRIQVISEEELLGDISYISLNPAIGFGRLVIGEADQAPGPFDITILRNLPNELSRTGGIISSTVQTPLSHVNLRAIQDGIPNAFIKDAEIDQRLEPLLGQFVRFEVTRDTFFIRLATALEVDQHYDQLRPDTVAQFQADLSETRIQNLRDIGFSEAISYGAKAANVAEMHRFNFESGTIPEGFAIPFSFYDEFMELNGFYTTIETMLADPDFQRDFVIREQSLKNLRDQIKDGDFSPEAFQALTDLQEQFPATTPIRCRSSTNGEDLPGFSGAGLYDSKTQHPDEGHIVKSVRQVFASMWNYRAYLERDFYRVDHLSAMMGILVHPSYKEERVNGVGVSGDPIYSRSDYYYVNSQIDENLVTNPTNDAVPEELFIQEEGSGIGFNTFRRSNLVAFGERVLDTIYINELREKLGVIHEEFGILYDALDQREFAMEIEFKVDSAGQFIIKQARPWAGWNPDESSSTSSPIELAALQVYPNPVQEELNLVVPAGFAGRRTISILNVLGQEVFSMPVDLQGSQETITILEAGRLLSKGRYVVLLDGGKLSRSSAESRSPKPVLIQVQ